MQYTEFRDSIHADLRRSSSGKTWKELKASLNLPYSQPCQEWICRLEREIGLERREKKRNALVWKVRER
jgi:hypothetical protein